MAPFPSKPGILMWGVSCVRNESWGRDRRIPGAPYPASLAYLVCVVLSSERLQKTSIAPEE